MSVNSSEFSFTLASLRCLVVSNTEIFDSLSELYKYYAGPKENPHIILTIEGRANYRVEGTEWPPYPGLKAEIVDEEKLHLSRIDMGGTLTIPTSPDIPVRGSFVLDPHSNSLESVIRTAFAAALPRITALMLHSSAIEVNGQSFIFAGKSGAGKSTISEILSTQFPDITKISDEMMIIALKNGRWSVCISPFRGSPELPQGKIIPVQSINFLIQSTYNKRTALHPNVALKEFMQHIFVYAALPHTANEVLSTAVDFITQVPAFNLEFTKSPDVRTVLDGD